MAERLGDPRPAINCAVLLISGRVDSIEQRLLEGLLRLDLILSVLRDGSRVLLYTPAQVDDRCPSVLYSILVPSRLRDCQLLLCCRQVVLERGALSLQPTAGGLGYPEVGLCELLGREIPTLSATARDPELQALQRCRSPRSDCLDRVR
jgi:hypothetical protein